MASYSYRFPISVSFKSVFHVPQFSARLCLKRVLLREAPRNPTLENSSVLLCPTLSNINRDQKTLSVSIQKALSGNKVIYLEAARTDERAAGEQTPSIITNFPASVYASCKYQYPGSLYLCRRPRPLPKKKRAPGPAWPPQDYLALRCMRCVKL
jgi:hypothetical protein